MSHDIFISYSRVDSAFALRLVRDLKERGFEVWLDQVEIGAGENWDDEIEKALDYAKTIMVLVSAASSKSENVKNEIGAALERGKQVVPVLLAKGAVPLMINRLQREDFTGDYDTALRKLLQRLSGGSRTSTLKAITDEDVARMASASAARLGLSADSVVKPDSLSPATVGRTLEPARSAKARNTLLASGGGAVLTACVALAFVLSRQSPSSEPQQQPIAAGPSKPEPAAVVVDPPKPAAVVVDPPKPEPALVIASSPRPGPKSGPRSKAGPTPQGIKQAEPAAQPEPAPEAAPAKKPMAVLCQEPNYGGICRKITTHPNLINTMVGNDTASSLKLGGCDAVKVCSDVFLSGACATFAADTPDLNGTAVGDDSVSSIECIVQTGPAPITGPITEE